MCLEFYGHGCAARITTGSALGIVLPKILGGGGMTSVSARLLWLSTDSTSTTMSEADEIDPSATPMFEAGEMAPSALPMSEANEMVPIQRPHPKPT